MISAMPMMPMLPAKAVSTVRVFFVIRLFNESASAVKKLMEVCFCFACGSISSLSSAGGQLSAVISPSLMRMIRLA